MSLFAGNRALLEAFRRGEREALGAVYDAYARDVAAVIRRGFFLGARQLAVPGVGDPQRQLELVQDTFLKVFEERARLAYDGLSPFRPWLLRIAKNLVIDHGRRAGRLQAPEHGALLAGTEEDALLPVSPEEELEWKTLREATRAWCATLSAELQQFVRLRFEEERSQAQVAAAMGVTRRRARTLEATVRDGLRRHLARGGFTDQPASLEVAAARPDDPDVGELA